MAKYVLNYESGDYEWINEDGYSVDRGEYIYNWDDSEYRREREEEEERLREEEERRREEEENSWSGCSDDEW